MRHIVILDRDGVINHDSRHYIKSPEEFVPLPGSIDAIIQLKHAGCAVFVATNQSGLARGLYDEPTLSAIHAKLHALLAAALPKVVLDDIVFCPHGPDDQCNCRKPAPGLLQQLATKHNLDLTQSWFVGDSARDIEAAQTVGARPALVLTGNGQQAQSTVSQDVPVFASLAAFAKALLQ